MISFTTPLAGAAFLVVFAGTSVAADADLEAGRMIFNETAVPTCAVCHTLGDAGAEGEVGPDLDELDPTFEQVRAAVTSGIGVMPAFSETLSEADIETVSRYVAQVAGANHSSAAAPSGETAVDAPGVELLSIGDAGAGELAFRKCQACHTVEEDGANRVGPNLHGIVGASVASVDGFRYSGALKEHGGIWSPDRLAEFLAAPRAAVPGTKMAFAGLRSEQERADVVAYLASLGGD